MILDPRVGGNEGASRTMLGDALSGIGAPSECVALLAPQLSRGTRSRQPFRTMNWYG
jgi:hypothetical protein